MVQEGGLHMNLWDKDGKHMLSCECGSITFDDIGDTGRKIVCQSCGKVRVPKKEGCIK